MCLLTALPSDYVLEDSEHPSDICEREREVGCGSRETMLHAIGERTPLLPVDLLDIVVLVTGRIPIRRCQRLDYIASNYTFPAFSLNVLGQAGKVSTIVDRDSNRVPLEYKV